MEIIKEENPNPQGAPQAITIIPERSIPLSANLRSDKTNVTERARSLAELSKKSPLHGKHGKRKTTLMKEDVFKQIQHKLLERSFKLLNTQTIIAHGTLSVFKIKSEWVGVGKKRWLKKGKPQLVINDHEIAAALNWEYGNRDEDDNPNSDEEYFFIVKNSPNDRAIKDQLDRIFGPSTQKIDLSLTAVQKQPITGMEIIKEESIEIHENSIPIE